MKNFVRKVKNVVIDQDKPISLIHFITNRCNARCDHCFIDFGNKDSQSAKISIENIEKLSKTFGEQLMNINLTGGEPFLVKEIEDIARIYFQNTSIDSLFITTHGGFTDRILNFTEKILKDFPNKRIIYSISIDGFEEVHNKIRKVKNLYRNAISTYHAIKNLELPVDVNVAITVTPYNYKGILSFYQHLREVEGIKTVSVTLVRSEGVYTFDQDQSEVLSAYRKLTKKVSEDTKLDGGYDKSNYLGRMTNTKNKIMNELIADTHEKNSFIMPCKASRVFGVIYPDGSVSPCETLDKKIGNLYDVDFNFLELWNSQTNKELQKWILETKCFCTYECAWSYNILTNSSYYGKFMKSYLG